MLSCVVIGAGPGGIVCTKELLEHGLDDVVCFERSGALGGTFAKSYDSLELTSSTTFSMFSDWWVGDDRRHHFWTWREALAYWTSYAEHFGVLEKIRFDSEVRAVSAVDGGWKVELATGEQVHARRVAVVAGNNSVPRFPAWAEELRDVPYSHSMLYRNAKPFEGKRVLVVGGGESGSDVAYEIARSAARCWVSLRETTGWVVPRKRGEVAADVSTHRGLWGLPRGHGERLSKRLIESERAKRDPVFDVVADLNERVRARRGIWGTFGTKTLALPWAVARHGARLVGDVVGVEQGGRTLRTADGATLDDVDAVVFCTGYRNRVAFLPEALQECDPRALYKHMFHPEHRDRIAWLGWARPGFGSQFPIMEMQARLFALVCAGRHALPDGATLERVIAADREQWYEQFEDNARRIRSLVDYHRYMDDLAGLIGCAPPLWRYALLHPRLWRTMVYGPTQATQFRLRGPGKKVELAHEILAKLPVSGWNHVVKAGARGRIEQAWRALLPRKGEAA